MKMSKKVTIKMQKEIKQKTEDRKLKTATRHRKSERDSESKSERERGG